MTAALLLAMAMLVWGPSRRSYRSFGRPVVEVGRPAAEPGLVRFRWPLVLLTGVAVWAFLGGPVGVLGGLVAGAGAHRIVTGAESAAQAQATARIARDLPGAVDLLMSALDAGAAVEPALGLVADAVGGPVGAEFSRIRTSLAIGADPRAVWSDEALAPGTRSLGRAMVRAQLAGASVVDAGRAIAVELRERADAEVEQRARAVSTKAAAPLGLCLLPAFVLLGIVPLVAGLVAELDLL